MPRLSLIVLLVLACSAAVPCRATVFAHPVADINANTALLAVVDQLAAADRVRSRFRQVKTLKLLSRPLVSEGQMVFDRSRGLCWLTRTPVASKLVVTSQRIVQGSGDHSDSITAQTNPVAFGFAQTFFQVLTGDLQALQQQFKVFFQQREAQWQIGLVPKDAELRNVLQAIVLSGADDLDTVTITDHAGDDTAIEFVDRRLGGEVLTQQEREYFDL